MGSSRQEHWSGFLCPPPGDLSYPGTEPSSLASPALQADCLPVIIYQIVYLGSPDIPHRGLIKMIAFQPVLGQCVRRINGCEADTWCVTAGSVGQDHAGRLGCAHCRGPRPWVTPSRPRGRRVWPPARRASLSPKREGSADARYSMSAPRKPDEREKPDAEGHMVRDPRMWSVQGGPIHSEGGSVVPGGWAGCERPGVAWRWWSHHVENVR